LVFVENPAKLTKLGGKLDFTLYFLPVGTISVPIPIPQASASVVLLAVAMIACLMTVCLVWVRPKFRTGKKPRN
jgi:hypothetical protein